MMNKNAQDLVIAEYVWIGGNGAWDLRSKARTLAGPVYSINMIPFWSYDGSACG
jgi:glutamine synthetase